MKEFELKYGCNPNQKPSKIYMHDGTELPIEILNGRPGYINFLDAFNSYQLVRELKAALGIDAADLAGWYQRRDGGLDIFFVAEKELSLPEDAFVLLVDNTRIALSKLACRLYENPSLSMKVIGITGTKGKTTTAEMLTHILNQNGIFTGYIGTTGIFCGNSQFYFQITRRFISKIHFTVIDHSSL